MAEQRRSWRDLRARRMDEPGARQAYEAAQLAFSLGAKVRQLRETRGWSQTELARQSHMTQSAVARFEAGGTVPTLPLLYRLTRALGVSLIVEIGEPDQKQSGTAAGKTPTRPATDPVRRTAAT